MGVIDLDARVKKLESGESSGVDPTVIDQLEAAVTALEETVNGDGETDLGLVGDVAALQAEIENLPVGINYSTTEKEVGTWTDGKKVYQKTYVNYPVSASTSSTGVDVLSYFGATKLIAAEGYITQTEAYGTTTYTIGSYINANRHSGVYVDTSDILNVYHENTTNTQTITLTIRYLKA